MSERCKLLGKPLYSCMKPLSSEQLMEDRILQNPKKCKTKRWKDDKTKLKHWASPWGEWALLFDVCHLLCGLPHSYLSNYECLEVHSLVWCLINLVFIHILRHCILTGGAIPKEISLMILQMHFQFLLGRKTDFSFQKYAVWLQIIYNNRFWWVISLLVCCSIPIKTSAINVNFLKVSFAIFCHTASDRITRTFL